METHGPRMDAEGHRGIGLGLLLQHDFAGHDQAFVAAPADTPSLNSSRRSAKARMSMPSRKMKENRPDVPVRPGGQPVGKAGMADRLDDRVILQALRDLEGRLPGAPACGSAACAGRGSAARHRTARACRRDRDRPRARMRPISSFEPATTPATTSLWPPRYFDAEWTTRSTPSDSGRWKIGLAQLLSMMVEDAVRAWQARQARRRHGSSITQLVGLSM